MKIGTLVIKLLFYYSLNVLSPATVFEPPVFVYHEFDYELISYGDPVGGR